MTDQIDGIIAGMSEAQKRRLAYGRQAIAKIRKRIKTLYPNDPLQEPVRPYRNAFAEQIVRARLEASNG